MSVTKEQVEAEGKKLGLTLSPEQVSAYVTIGDLPVKKDGAGTPPGDHDDDDDPDKDKGMGEGAKKRIQQLNDQKKAAKAEAEAAKKRADDAEARLAEANKKKSIEAGDYDKLAAAAKADQDKAVAAIQKSKDRTRALAVNSAITKELLAQGIENDRLPDALILLDKSKVPFEWTKEDDLEYEIDDEAVSTLVEDFKKSRPYLWGEAGEGDDADKGKGFSGRKPAGKNLGNRMTKEKEYAERKARKPWLYD